MKICIMRRASILMSVLLAVTLIVPIFSVSSHAASNNDDPTIIVSLGDSYSSGEGITPFFGQEKNLYEKVQDEDWLAHRSTKSWPSMLRIPDIDGTMSEYNVKTASSNKCKWYFVAASGAMTQHLNNKQLKPYQKELVIDGHYVSGHDIIGTGELPKQLDVFNGIKGKVDYVTLTIGGNDVDFSGIITACATGSSYLDFNWFQKKFDERIEDVWANINTTKANIKQAYYDIQNAAGNQATIIVAGYPKLLDKDGKGALISKEEATTVNESVTEFNKIIYNLVGECSDDGMKIRYVDVESGFDNDGGHQAYSKEPWINKIEIKKQSEDLEDSGWGSSYSIHPNEEGAKYYADCVNAEIEKIENEKQPLEFNNHYYKFYDNSMTWEEAKAFCEEQGGHLVTITSADEQDAIYEYAKQFDIHSDIWIGVSDTNVEGDWSHWITGEEVTFTNWGTGEPDNYQGIEQDYGVMCMEHKSGSGYEVQPGQWDDIAANGETASGYFICEWDNNETVFEAGDGSEENPYQVSNAEQLDAVRNDLTAHYIQVADIDMSGYEWSPIGTGYGGGTFRPPFGAPSTENIPFEGEYNGNNYKITNLSITENEHDTVGLFGLCSENSKIENITIENLSISVDKSSTDYVEQWENGAVNAVSVGGIAGRCESIVSNCKVSGNIEVINCNSAFVGGILGYGGVIGSSNYADIYVLSNRDSRYTNDGDVRCGGVTGHPGAVSGTVGRCTNYGNIDAISGHTMYCGGISGNHGAIEKCVNYGDVNGSTSNDHSYSNSAGNCNVGGIVGATSGQTLDSVNYGRINGDAGLGASCYAGGVAGKNGYYGNGIIENCFNVGDTITATKLIEQDEVIVSVAGEAGRIAGRSQSTTNCYSVDSTLVNGGIPDTNIGADNLNGASLSKEDIESMVNQLLSSN